MAGAGRKIGMMQVIGLDTGLDKGAHQLGKNCRVVIDAFQKHGLADHGDAGINQACRSVPCGFAEFSGMIGVQGHIGGFAAGLQRIDQ
ncbi:hypothetical protein D3C80_1968410 [compost metagenome]